MKNKEDLQNLFDFIKNRLDIILGILLLIVLIVKVCREKPSDIESNREV